MIKLNTQAKEQRINTNYLEALDKISKYAEEGHDLTEHIFPKDIYEEVRTKLGDHMKALFLLFSSE